MTNASSATLRTGNESLFVQETGAGDPVLMLSGLGYASWCWEEVMSGLSNDYRVIALDNRGAGRSAKPPGPYSIEMFADDAAAALDALKIDAAHVVGNSMGGYIALVLAARHPAKVRSLVLSNTTHGGEGALNIPKATSEAWEKASSLSPREFARHTMAYSYPPGWAEANPERFEAIFQRRVEFPTPRDCWHAQFAACNHFIEHGLDVSAIEQPALVIHGTEDRIIPYENGPRLVRALPHGELRTLEGVGHIPLLEDPPLFTAIVRQFFAAREGSK